MMRTRRRVYLVCYDVCGERKAAARRLRKVYQTMRAFGEHVQYSVFRCILTDRQVAELEHALDAAISHREDQVLILPLGDADGVEGWQGWTLGIPIGDPERVVRIV